MTTIKATTKRRSSVIRGGEVGRCLTRIHHSRFTEAVGEVSAARARLADRGIEFEAGVIDEIVATTQHSVAVINGQIGDPYQATLQVLDDGVDIIIGGRIKSADGVLVGAPDLLIRMPDGYAAVDVKSHKVLTESGAPVRLAPLNDLAASNPSDTWRFRSFRKRDLFQVAHYWRILDSLSLATAAAVGGVIGTDEPVGCTWVDLDIEDSSIVAETIEWVDAATRAIAYGTDHPGTPLVTAWWRGECNSCDWRLLCHDQLTAVDDPTLIRGITDVERTLLGGSGIVTGEDIAALDLDDDRIGDPAIVLDARVRTAGHLMQISPAAGQVDLPSARREVDFDIETYGGRIYLAGFLVTENEESHFDPVVDWVGSEATERRFVGEMFDRLAEYGNDDTIVLHWSEYERSQLQAASERHGLSIKGFDSVGQWFDRFAVDLYDWTRSTFLSPHGFSLKAIAPMCGFEWRDDDPGGLQSEIWYEMMLAGDESMRQRLLEYNEDDVAAQLAIRRWIRTQDGGGGPGSSIPSVHTWKP